MRRQDRRLGLGLTLCAGYCALMDGRLGVRSAVGGGSTFWIECPRTPVAGDAAASAPQLLRAG